MRDDYDFICEADYVTYARELGLSGAEFISNLSLGEIRFAYNGIGPEWMSRSFRKKLDKWLKIFAVCAVIHDCRFAYDNDGSDAKFRAANDELERNCLIVADAEYKWYNPLRYLWRHRGRVMAEACMDFGWSAWRDAYEENKNQKPKGTNQ